MSFLGCLGLFGFSVSELCVSLEVIVSGAFSLTLRSVVKSMKKKETQIKKMAENSEKKSKLLVQVKCCMYLKRNKGKFKEIGSRLNTQGCFFYLIKIYSLTNLA